MTPTLKIRLSGARRSIRESNLHSLPFHHHVIYTILQKAGRLSAGELHAQYEEVAKTVYYDHDLTPIGRRARRNKLTKLQEYDLIEYEGPPQNRFYAVCDKSIESPVDIGPVGKRAE